MARAYTNRRQVETLILCVLLALTGCAPGGQGDGSVMLVGGGRMPLEAVQRFADAAGDTRRVVVLTGASPMPLRGDVREIERLFRWAGASDVVIPENDFASVSRALEAADGVWLMGGDEWRVLEAYPRADFRRALLTVLARGGIVGGTSAGASVLGATLVRGASSDSPLRVELGAIQGFGLLPDVIIDSHLLTRDRKDLFRRVVMKTRSAVGLGLDEGAVVVIRSNTVESMGLGVALICCDALGEMRYLVPRTPTPLERWEVRADRQ